MTFRRRLLLGSAGVLVFAVLVLVTAEERALRRDLPRQAAAALARDALILREAIPSDSLAWQDLVRRYAAQTGLRITLIDATGRVRADSDFPPGPLPPGLENHLHRPEVQAALGGRTGEAIRVSHTVGRDLLYVAVAGGPGVVRVADDLSRVEAVVHGAQRQVLGAAALALLVGLAAALATARSIARPLTSLSGAAHAIAAGQAPVFPRSPVAEISTLTDTLRTMQRELGERFAEIRREKDESAALVEAMVEGVIAADADGRLVAANAAARALLNLPAGQPLPRLKELLRTPDASELLRRVAADAAADGTLELGGRVVQAHFRRLPAQGVLVVQHDVTELRRLEAVRRDFVANVSHELKTPLTSITGYAETLAEPGTDPETARGFSRVILANARRMQRLVDDLLDLSRIEAGVWQPAAEPVNVAAVARETWATLRTGTEEHLRLDAERAGTLTADPEALRQILTNLLGNAARYAPPGSAIEVATAADATGASLLVHDRGPGIGAEHLPRIFERFYRADPGRSRAEGGTGLGLAIVKHLVETHGGRVEAESSPGRGTTIRCWFPDRSA